MILLYETESPLTLLESKSKDGAKVSLADAKIVESLLLDYKLLPGVANVLLDFVLEISDMKLNKAFIEKIAGQWARKNIKTVKDAMALAKGEYKQRAEWQKGTAPSATTKEKSSKLSSGNRYVRKDRLPKWLTEEKSEPTNAQDEDIEKIKEELELKLKQFKSQIKKEG
jgi:replication initiation and membrane attachment protein